MAEENTQSGGGTGVRGASHPFVDLEAAVGRAKALYAAEGRTPAPMSAMAKAWGYSEKSSGLRQTIAALLQFGVAEDIGTGDDRKLKLTTRGLDLVLAPAADPRREEALIDAAKAPKIYFDLLMQFDPTALPSDETLAYHLQRERSVNPNSVQDLIKNFRSTVKYAGLDKGPEFNPQYEIRQEDLPVYGDPSLKRQNSQPWPNSQQLRSIPDGSLANALSPIVRTDQFTLDDGQIITLQWPCELTVEGYEEFKQWIELVVKKIGRVAVKRPSSDGTELAG